MLAVSIRIPPSLRSPRASPSHRSFGHFSRTSGCRLSATLIPTASDSPDQSGGASGRPSEKVSDAPGALRQGRPSRPRPAVCCSATSRTGAMCPSRARPIRSVLVESLSRSTSTLKPGRTAASARSIDRCGQRTAPVLMVSGLAPLGRQQGAAAVRRAAPAWVFGLELGRVALVDDQAVVVVQLLARANIAQRLDEDAPALFVGFAVRVARVVDPARGVAAHLGVDHVLFVDVEKKRMVRILGIVRMPRLRGLPGHDLAHILDKGFALGDILHGENALAVNARAAGLDAAA